MHESEWLQGETIHGFKISCTETYYRGSEEKASTRRDNVYGLQKGLSLDTSGKNCEDHPILPSNQ